jgi:hypothetical protein
MFLFLVNTHLPKTKCFWFWQTHIYQKQDVFVFVTHAFVINKTLLFWTHMCVPKTKSSCLWQTRVWQKQKHLAFWRTRVYQNDNKLVFGKHVLTILKCMGKQWVENTRLPKTCILCLESEKTRRPKKHNDNLTLTINKKFLFWQTRLYHKQKVLVYDKLVFA